MVLLKMKLLIGFFESCIDNYIYERKKLPCISVIIMISTPSTLYKPELFGTNILLKLYFYIMVKPQFISKPVETHEN